MVELLIVVQAVAGSNPVIHPIFVLRTKYEGAQSPTSVIVGVGLFMDFLP